MKVDEEKLYLMIQAMQASNPAIDAIVEESFMRAKVLAAPEGSQVTYSLPGKKYLVYGATHV